MRYLLKRILDERKIFKIPLLIIGAQEEALAFTRSINNDIGMSSYKIVGLISDKTPIKVLEKYSNLSEKEKIEFLPVGHYEYKNFKGKTFSLFPFGCPSVCVSYSGTKYPLEKYCVSSSVTLGVSNVFTSDMATIDIYDGNAILIINLIDC